MGRGNHIFRDPGYKPEPYNIDFDAIDRRYHTSKEQIEGDRLVMVPVNTPKAEISEPEISGMAAIFYNKTLEQAEEIGQLKARIRSLEQRLEKTAGDVSTGDTANVG